MKKKDEIVALWNSIRKEHPGISPESFAAMVIELGWIRLEHIRLVIQSFSKINRHRHIDRITFEDDFLKIFAYQKESFELFRQVFFKDKDAKRISPNFSPYENKINRDIQSLKKIEEEKQQINAMFYAYNQMFFRTKIKLILNRRKCIEADNFFFEK